MKTQVYVGTYAKYNNGNLSGEWLMISDFSDKDEFIEECLKLHSDEEYPELMFQDIDGEHFGMITESGIDEEIFELVHQLDEGEAEIFAAYRKNITEGTWSDCQDAYSGTYDSDEEFAEDMSEQFGMMSGKIAWPFTCIDWEYAARELMYDYFEQDGHYFRNC